MPWIIFRFVARELLMTWSIVALVLGIIVFGSALTETLYMVAKGSVSGEGAAVVMIAEFFRLWKVVLPLSSAIATALVVTRLYTSSEMAGISSCGIGGLILLIPVSMAFLPLAILGWYVSAFALPNFEKSKLDFLSQAGPATMLSQIESKSLRQFGQGLILHVDEATPETLDKVFIYQRQSDGSTVIEVAQSAQIDVVDQGAELRLNDGQALHWQNDDVRTVDYKTHRGTLRQWVKPKAGSLDEFNWLELDNSPEHRVEFHSRIVIPLLVAILPLLVTQLSHLNPRQSSARPIFMAVLVFLFLGNIVAYILDSPAVRQNVLLLYVPMFFTAFLAIFLARKRDRHL